MNAELRCTVFTLGNVAFSGCVFEQGGFFKKANKKLCADFDLCANQSAFSLICLLPLSLFTINNSILPFIMLYFPIY